MAVFRSLWRPRLFSFSPASARLASWSANQRAHEQGGPQRDATRRGPSRQGGFKQGGAGLIGGNAEPKTVKALLPENVRLFVRPDRTFATTKECARFLQEHDIEWDTGKAFKFQASGELRSLLGSSLQMAWSPRHIIHPYHLKYLSPRGDPLAPSFMHRYAENTLKQPLWVHVTPSNGANAVVRTTARSKLKRAILTALEDRGYTGAGVGASREIRGTLWINDVNSVRSVNLPLARVGKLIAEELDKRYSQPLSD